MASVTIKGTAEMAFDLQLEHGNAGEVEAALRCEYEYERFVTKDQGLEEHVTPLSYTIKRNGAKEWRAITAAEELLLVYLLGATGSARLLDELKAQARNQVSVLHEQNAALRAAQ